MACVPFNQDEELLYSKQAVNCVNEVTMDKHDRSHLDALDLKDPWQFLAVGFGSGLLPKAPGTFGSLAALPFCAALLFCPWWFCIAFIVVFSFFGIIASSRTEKVLGMHDNSAIVVDEFAGMFVTVLFYPSDLYWLLLAFVLFRLFDILKPFPISYLDKHVGGGLGVMIDDLLAGAMACVCSHFVFWCVY